MWILPLKQHLKYTKQYILVSFYFKYFKYQVFGIQLQLVRSAILLAIYHSSSVFVWLSPLQQHCLFTEKVPFSNISLNPNVHESPSLSALHLLSMVLGTQSELRIEAYVAYKFTFRIIFCAYLKPCHFHCLWVETRLAEQIDKNYSWNYNLSFWFANLME